MSKVVVAIQAAIFLVLVPVLEISDTHLFAADWPAHARLHEAWQLMTNAGLSALACWFAWGLKRPVSALAVAMAVTLPFCCAWASRGLYGGSMQHADGRALAIAGLDVAAMIMLALAGAMALALIRESAVRDEGARR